MKRYLKIHENLGDGQHPQVIEPTKANLATLAEAIGDWYQSEEPGCEPVTIEIVEMKEAEFEAIPEL